MLSIGLIGDGNWAQIVKKEINISNNFELKSVFSRKKFNLSNNYSYTKYLNYEEMITNERLDAIYVATNPNVNFEVFKFLKNKKIPVIFEKPLTSNVKECEEMYNFISEYKWCVLTNLPNIYSDIFKHLKLFIDKNKNDINKIYLIEGNNGPKKLDVNPLFDWGIHPLSLVFRLYNNKELSYIGHNIIKTSSRAIAAKVSLIDNNTRIKIFTGNNFKKKNQKSQNYIKK